MAQKQKGNVDMEKMMKVYRKLGTPGAPHKKLAALAGRWSTKTKAWMEPDKPPMEGTGSCEQKMILDGRYLQQEYTGDMMGSPFTGINVIGYDNHSKKYVSTWIDSMSTGIYYFEGEGSGKTITQQCSYDDPVRGPMVWRSVTRIVDDNTLKYEMYLTPKRGKEEKMMEMRAERETLSKEEPPGSSMARQRSSSPGYGETVTGSTDEKAITRTGRGDIREAMDVIGSDGHVIGTVKEIREADFLVDRRMARDIYIPFSAIADTEGRIILNVPSDQVNAMEWERAPIMGTREGKPVFPS